MPLTPAELPVILRTVVGSQAHGVARPDSDYDYREVFYTPTRQLLALPVSARPKDSWMTAPLHNMTDDEGGYEVGHFLEMCMKGNPNLVEMFWTTVDSQTEDGEALLRLAPAVLGSEALVSAFSGYASNARDKIITDYKRALKWQSTYVRILATVVELLTVGHVHYPITQYAWGEEVRAIRDGAVPTDHVLELGKDLEARLRAFKGQPSKLRPEPDLERVNAWLQDFRLRHWEE